MYWNSFYFFFNNIYFNQIIMKSKIKMCNKIRLINKNNNNPKILEFSTLYY